MTVTSVNDAPVLTASTPSLTTITEDDLDGDGQTISEIINGSVNDVDSNSLGIAVIYLYPSDGTWQYQINNGDWSNFGDIEENTAFLLGPDDKMRFVPNGENADVAEFDYYAWDLTSNAAGDTVDLSDNDNRGGSTAFSTNDDRASITVTAVNDAPVLDNSGATVFNQGTDENTTSDAQLVSTLLNGIISDVDNNADEGIAVHAISGNGTWQYSLDGNMWTDVGVVDGENALLLESTHGLRYIPDGDNGETATIQFYAWDTTSGSSGEKVDTSIRGDETAFSTDSETASMTITDVNDAPVLDNSGDIAFDVNTNEDTTSNGQLVGLLLENTVTDADSAALFGMAIHNLSGNGTWQYSLDGNTWTDVGSVASNNALLLNVDDQIRYIPDGESGESATIDYYAWDQTSSTAGNKVDASTRGTSTAFSSASETATMTITSVNDAPLLTDSDYTLSTISADETSNSGTTVTSLLDNNFSDVDSDATEGIAITNLTATNGSWQYKVASGEWTDTGSVSDAQSLLLSSTDSIRFVPDGSNGETPSFSFRAWDGSAGTAGNKVDSSTHGSTSAFSSFEDTANLTVTTVASTENNFINNLNFIEDSNENDNDRANKQVMVNDFNPVINYNLPNSLEILELSFGSNDATNDIYGLDSLNNIDANIENINEIFNLIDSIAGSGGDVPINTLGDRLINTITPNTILTPDMVNDVIKNVQTDANTQQSTANDNQNINPEPQDNQNQNTQQQQNQNTQQQQPQQQDNNANTPLSNAADNNHTYTRASINERLQKTVKRLQADFDNF